MDGSLPDRLSRAITMAGPIPLSQYMAAANAEYYATRDPLGSAGDFTTAPEVSQMFGELIGLWAADLWQRAGEPDIYWVELGPGRGTLTADAMRAMGRVGLDPPVHFVETSPTLRARQRAAVPYATWHDDITQLPDDRPVIVVANEFFDALPIRQLVDGRQRRVIAAAGGLAFDRDGDIVESSPVREEAVAALAARLAKQGGVALIIDYGHERSAPGDTLQAVRRHRFAHVLESPGEQDLTSHVDFEALGTAAREAGAIVSTVTEQGPWLERLGIIARASALSARAPDRAQEIEAARARLCRPDAMGSLFKVMAIHALSWPAPAGFNL